MRRRYRYHAAKRFGSINKYLPMLYDGIGDYLNQMIENEFEIQNGTIIEW